MKRYFVLFCILLLLFPAFASHESGRAGISLDYMRYYNHDLSSVDASELILSLEGANFFGSGKSRIFGVGYSVGYGFPFGSLSKFNPVHMAASALFSFDASEWLSLELKAGIADTVFIFGNTVSNEVGLAAGTALQFRPLDFLGIGLSFDYIFPLMTSYGNTVRLTRGEKHILSYSLTVSYLY